MAERIIPIQIEGQQDSEDSTPETEKNKLLRSMGELSVEQTDTHDNPTTSKGESSPKKVNVQVKPAPQSPDNQQEYLKEFDVLEKRDGNILSDYSLPNVDAVERIVLVIDRAQDENCTPFTIGNTKYTPLSMLKRAILIFIKLKHTINPLHEFAVIVLNESDAKLLLNFTSDYRKLHDCINKISECETEDIFDLNLLFDIITEAEPPEILAPGLAPPYVLRTIIFYGRSYTVPELTPTNRIEKFLSHPFFTCDILMTHEPVESSNHCGKIFNILQNLDKKGTAYFFPVCRDSRRMHRCTGKLLAHPLQRPIQKLIKS